MQKSETAVDVYKQHLEPSSVRKSAVPLRSEPTDAAEVYKSFFTKAEDETEEEKKKREEAEEKSKEDK